MSKAPHPAQTQLVVAQMKGRKSVPFDITVDDAQTADIVETLDLLGLRKVSFAGTLKPSGREDWTLNARLGATAVQPCSITLEPVTTRIDTAVVRQFVTQMPEARIDEADDDGTPMLEDDTLEPLGREIDLLRTLREALALALPDYPRADGADLGDAVFTEPGKDAMTDDDAKPFAGLAALKDQLTPKS